jgi:putative hydrolase
MTEESFELPPDLLKQIPLFAEIAKVLSWTGGPINWDLARQVAVALAAADEKTHEVAPGDADELTEAVRLAELWLAEGPGLPPPPRVATVRATTPARWAESAGSIREIVDPLAAKVLSAVREQAGDVAPESEAAMLGPVLAQMAPVLLGIQAGVVVGTLALDLLGTYDLPLPVAEEGGLDIIVPSVDAIAESYGLDRRETRLWVALHQSAHRALFEALPGPSAHFFALFHNYVAALDVDLSGAMERLQSLDVTSPERLQEAMEDEGFFGLLSTPATSEALARVQHQLALIEAFADQAVVAAADRLPTAPRIAEAMGRRLTEPGRGSRMFSRFVGLEVPPDRLRAGQAFCRGVVELSSWPALLRLWDDPGYLPAEAELADPASWLARVGA